MTKLNEIYKCNICGNIVEMVHTGAGELVCCGQPMELQNPKTKDEGQEKHVPVVEISGDTVIVNIGETEHPMTEEHYIEWVEVITNARVYRKTFTPGEKPFAKFFTPEEVTEVRIYCNIHGLWKNK